VACHPCGGSGRKKEKDQLQNFAKFRVEKATHRTLFLYEAMATICMATSTSLGAYFPSPRLAVYPTCSFNGDHLHGSIELLRHKFHVAWPASVPKAFKNIGKATTTMVVN
jgi:hypothetical protein